MTKKCLRSIWCWCWGGYEVAARIKKHVARTERLGTPNSRWLVGCLIWVPAAGCQRACSRNGRSRNFSCWLSSTTMIPLVVGHVCQRLRCWTSLFPDYIATGMNLLNWSRWLLVAEGPCPLKVGLIGGRNAWYVKNDYDFGLLFWSVRLPKQIIDGSCKEGWCF